MPRPSPDDTPCLDDELDIHNSDIPVVCKSCQARHRGICGTLAPEQLIHLSKHTTKTAYGAAKELVGEETEVKCYSNILSGVVKLSKMTKDGRQQIVGLQFAPDFLGRPFQSHANVTAEAATDVLVCSFPKSVLDKLITDNPELEHAIHQQNLQELDEAREWLLTLGRKTASEKVASFLHLIAMNMDPTHADKPQTAAFDLPLKRADIADFLGLTIETVSRQLTKLRKSGVIIVENNRHIVVPSMAKLKMACEQEN